MSFLAGLFLGIILGFLAGVKCVNIQHRTEKAAEDKNK